MAVNAGVPVTHPVVDICGGGLWFVGCTLGRSSDACIDFGENGRGGRLIFLSILSQLIHVLLSLSLSLPYPVDCTCVCDHYCRTISLPNTTPSHSFILFYQVASFCSFNLGCTTTVFNMRTCTSISEAKFFFN